MGAMAVAPLPVYSAQLPEPVTLHIYSLGTTEHLETVNKILRRLGTGVFHCGVEVPVARGDHAGTGVFWQPPRSNRLHSWVEAYPMGETRLQQPEVMSLVRRLRSDWHGLDYHLLKRNCCHFCDELCQHLGVGAIPGWVRNLAAQGAALADGIEAAAQVLDRAITLPAQACCDVHSVCCSLAPEFPKETTAVVVRECSGLRVACGSC
uniref:PPPDE domain-containing protein n=1 Tax=Alexandrium catenella TaxID=2925 RepID=A0A7S1RGX3_ALECA